MVNAITVGDTVLHKTKGIVGVVVAFKKRNGGVLVDYSDDSGIRFRCVHINNLEVIKCQTQNVHIKKEI
jgi:preprotein translocase subunit YajC